MTVVILKEMLTKTCLKKEVNFNKNISKSKISLLISSFDFRWLNSDIPINKANIPKIFIIVFDIFETYSASSSPSNAKNKHKLTEAITKIIRPAMVPLPELVKLPFSKNTLGLGLCTLLISTSFVFGLNKWDKGY